MAYMRGERLCGDARGDFGRCCRTRALLLDAISAGQVVLEDVRAARLAGLRTVARERSEAQRVARVWQREWSSALYPSCCARGVPLCKMAPPPDLPQSWERAHHIIVVRHFAEAIGKRLNAAVQSLLSHETASTSTLCPPRAEGLDKDGNSRMTL